MAFTKATPTAPQSGDFTRGFVAPGFEGVAEAFEINFRERSELGAAFAAVHNGKPVVDLWGGVADATNGRQWDEDTLQLIFSGTKGLVALCMLMLIDRKQIALDQPVSRYWPDFGKPNVLMRHIVSHTARLPGVDTPVTVADLAAPRKMADILARQEQSADPRAEHCYHSLTYGWLNGEVLRRVDGRTIGRFFAEEIAGPVGLELWIGLPPAEEARMSRLETGRSWANSQPTREDFAKDRLLWSISGNPPTFTPNSFPWNTPEWHQTEIPAANGIGTARSMAKLYGRIARDGAGIVSSGTMRLGRTPLASGYDVIGDRTWTFGVGFELQSPKFNYGPPQDAFGHGGAGGSNHGAWPSHGVGYSYCMNHMRANSGYDERARALLEALFAAVSA